ncbi:hypothetical protein CFP65_5894 [Kitasatospora sp. MMS16-BH015]|uniref:enolase C-terminal domain-like protein n=1 Tax=Kitasatospora sp. MMS16-BH015 TaxID=2018025 RepID=UPI000CA0F47F|nr:enolase C-terminal domain-like protein [Kitasatospora sp. MMS16-BH015]AUG80574.1 hypothetical protein CFP65_5894 [Kitasatospora sp. MMS16-BH015]
MISVDLLHARVSARTSWHLVRLRDADGACGYGEYSDAGPQAAALWREIAARLAAGAGVGEVVAALDTEEWSAAAPGEADPAVGRVGPRVRIAGAAVGPFTVGRFARLTVRGALDQAAADLAARRAGLPLWRWLGGAAARPVRRYANLNRALRSRTPEEHAAVAAAAVAVGYTAVKCAPFDGLPPAERLLGGLARLRAVRRAAPEAELMLDVHHLLTLSQVFAVSEELRALDLRWLEDAAALDDPAGLAVLAAAEIAPLAGGEFATDPGELAEALADGRLAWVLPDVKHAGGLAAARRLATAAQAAGAGVSLHNPSGPIATAMSTHLAIACGPAVETEFAFGEADWRHATIRPSEVPDGPWLLPAEGPGLGVEPDSEQWHTIPVCPTTTGA